MQKSKNKLSLKIIAAGITLLLGIILAIGYPTGGVKVSNVHKRNVVRKTTTTNTHKVNTQTTKKVDTKKRVNPPVVPPSSNDESGDEGC